MSKENSKFKWYELLNDILGNLELIDFYFIGSKKLVHQMAFKMKRMRKMMMNPMELLDQDEKRKHRENMYEKEILCLIFFILVFLGALS
jgi:hypothetical protein